MPQETIVYLVNLIIGVILAALMTHFWRLPWHTSNIGYWMVAAWVMTAADALFALRPELPYWVGRMFPTLMVTIGHGILWLGAQETARQPPRRRLVAAVVALHGVVLAWFLLSGSPSQWRMVCNGVIWGGLSLASFLSLRRSAPAFHQSVFTPANVFLLHAIFHGIRVSLATVFALKAWPTAAATLQTVGDLEVSFFMVALFVSLLISHLQIRYEELSRALIEVKTLTGLLPICAWCRKVRDDDGYWRQLEEYFTSHSQVKFTHGICGDCTREHFTRTATRVK